MSDWMRKTEKVRVPDGIATPTQAVSHGGIIYEARGPYAKMPPGVLYEQARKDFGAKHPVALLFGVAAGLVSPDKVRTRLWRMDFPRRDMEQPLLF